MKISQIIVETHGISAQDLADILFNRLITRYPDVVQQHGHERVGDAVDYVAQFHAGAEELGTSDIGIMVRQILKTLQDQGVEEDLSPNWNLAVKQSVQRDRLKSIRLLIDYYRRKGRRDQVEKLQQQMRQLGVTEDTSADENKWSVECQGKEYACNDQDHAVNKARSLLNYGGKLAVIKQNNIPKYQWKVGQRIEPLDNEKPSVVEGNRVKTASGDYTNPHTGVTYSKPTGQDGHDSYMTPEYLIKKYRERLAQIESGPHQYPKEVARLKAKIAKLSKQGVVEGRDATDAEHKKAMDTLFKRPDVVAMSRSLKRRDQDAEYDAKQKQEFQKRLSKKKGVAEGDNLATFVGPNEDSTDAMDHRGAVTDSFYEDLARIKTLALSK